MILKRVLLKLFCHLQSIFSESGHVSAVCCSLGKEVSLWQLRFSPSICEGCLELSQHVCCVCVICLLTNINHPLEALANVLHS